MEINKFNRMGMIRSYQKTTQPSLDKENTKESKVQPKGQSRDQLEISNEAIEQLKRAKGDSNVSDKIERLKQQVESGTYQVNSEKAAERLLALWKKN